MRKIVALFFVIFALSLFAAAQGEAPKAELFGGYSLLHNGNGGLIGTNSSGWELAGTYNLNRFLGATADFDGHYNSGFHDYNFLFGPTLGARLPKVTPFAHALFGGSHVGGAGASDTAFGMALGGGLDWEATSLIGVRLIQGDYLLTRFGGDTQNNARFSFGLKLKF